MMAVPAPPGKGFVAGHAFQPVHFGMGPCVRFVAARHEGKFAAFGFYVVHIDLNLDVQRMAVGYVGVPAGVCHGPRRDSSGLR